MLDVSKAPSAAEIGYFDLYPSSDAGTVQRHMVQLPLLPIRRGGGQPHRRGVVSVEAQLLHCQHDGGFGLLQRNGDHHVVNGAATASSSYSVSGVPAGASVNVINNNDGAIHHGQRIPARSDCVVHLDGRDNTGQTGTVNFTVYDCDNEVFGCTDSGANNFNPGATLDDGSCTYPCSDVSVTILTDNYPSRKPRGP